MLVGNTIGSSIGSLVHRMVMVLSTLREQPINCCSKTESGVNKAGYTAIPVADGWAGAEMRVFTLFDLCTPTDRRTNRPTDQRTDGRTKPLKELGVRN